MPGPAYHIRATLLPFGDEPVDLWVRDGRLTLQPQNGAEELGPARSYALAGLVDAHVHLTMDFNDTGLEPGSPEVVEANRKAHMAAGVLLVRDIGGLTDAAVGASNNGVLPRVRAAGRFLAPPKGYFGFQQVARPEGLEKAVAGQARRGIQWIKLIGTWPVDTPRGGLNYPVEVMTAAVRTAHQAGARVAVHVTNRDGVAACVAAGVDSIEHGMGVDEGLLGEMARRKTAWVPTLCIFPALAQGMDHQGASEAARYLREGLEQMRAMVPVAKRLGVPVLAGTDMLPHGSVPVEIAALRQAGLEPRDALAAASSVARAFLGEPDLGEGSPADIVLYKDDPREHPEALARPAIVMLGGQVAQAVR